MLNRPKPKSASPNSELRRSLSLVITGISFGIAFFTVIGGAPLTGFLRALGVGHFMYSVIMALPMATGVLQVFAAYYLENHGNRKRMFIIMGCFRFLWIPVALTPLVLPAEQRAVATGIIAVLIGIYAAGNSITGVAFFSWMGSLVPEGIRGRFFSRRAMVYTIASAVMGFLVGKFLDEVAGFDGFAILFVTVAVMGVIDILCFLGVKDPPMEIPRERLPFFKFFAEPFQNRNYLRFIIFITIWNFGINFSAAFFNVYMLENLKMEYLTIFLCTQLISNLATVVFVQGWGKLADRFGNKPVALLCGMVITIFPLLWLLVVPGNPAYLWIIGLINFLAGICWPGFEVTTTNLSIWLAPTKNRSIYIAIYTMITSLGSTLAFACGGLFMEYAGPWFYGLKAPFLFGQSLNSFQGLFFITCAIRLVALIFFLPRVQEHNSGSAGRVIRDFLGSLQNRFRIAFR